MGLTQKEFDALTREERADIMARYRAHVASTRPAPTVRTRGSTLPAMPALRADAHKQVAPVKRRVRPTLSPEPGFVYLAVDWLQYEHYGVVKIGYARNLKRRLSAANTWAKVEFVHTAPVSNMRSAERDMHNIFGEDHDVRERFKCDIEQACAVLDLVAQKYPLPDGAVVYP